MASSGIQTPLGRSAFTDGWDGYPQARARLLQTVADARCAFGGEHDDVRPCVEDEIHRLALDETGDDERSVATANDVDLARFPDRCAPRRNFADQTIHNRFDLEPVRVDAD
jgi:hypothetical protein